MSARGSEHDSLVAVDHDPILTVQGDRPGEHRPLDVGAAALQTAHYVTDELDAGPSIEQDPVRVSHVEEAATGSTGRRRQTAVGVYLLGPGVGCLIRGDVGQILRDVGDRLC